jgi:hypothetical protein
MLYLAFFKHQSGLATETDVVTKSRKWWNEGDKPAGLKTLGIYGSLGTNASDVLVFEASDHNDIRTMIEYWPEFSFEIHPAVDLAQFFRTQGMKVA